MPNYWKPPPPGCLYVYESSNLEGRNMPREQTPSLLDPIRRLIGGEGGCALTDAELLEKFAATADATSFEALIWRHGAMVLGLCRRILRDQHEAEDAFQATFLVFARKASSIGHREAVGCWLYKVAYRIALRLRAAANKRPTTGEPAEELPAPEPMEDADWRDLRPVLDEEIARLPEKYRAAFVLCYLEGRTNEEAAAQLGCPHGTILSRLSRGREWLRTRLTRRGVALTAASLTLTLSRNAVSAAVPVVLTRSTINAAVPFAAGKAATELVSTTVAALTDGVLRTMILTKVTIAATALLSLAVMGTGITWAARGDGATGPLRAPEAQAAKLPTSQATHQATNEAPIAEPIDQGFGLDEDRGRPSAGQQERGRGNESPTTNGKVVAIAKDGKSFTLEVPAQARGEEPGKIVIKITDKTAIVYNDVFENGAKLTEGYLAQVKLENGSKDVAEMVNFSGVETSRRGTDYTAEVVGSTKDSITVINGGPRGERGAEPKKETIPFDSKTVIEFGNVAAGQAKITEGQRAWIWLADDGKTAATVRLIGMAGDVGRRDEKRPDLSGQVAAVTSNGKQITVASHAQGRGEEPTKQEITIGDNASVIYNAIQVDGTKPTVGYRVQIWFAEGSKDAAAKVVFIGTVRERWTYITAKVVEVSALGKDGMTIAIEQPAGARGEEPKRTKIVIPASAKVFFSRVGPDEAKPSVGLLVQIRLKNDSNDTAAQATFFKLAPQDERGRR
jgi:RNA polymerase sigma factor (sigma-70 family)